MGGQNPFSPMLAKRSALALALALVGASLGVPDRGLAQPQPPAVNQRPATNEELSTYIGMATTNICILSQNTVPFKTAMNANLLMVANVLNVKHGGLLLGRQQPLKFEELADGSVPLVVLRVDAVCGKKLPADWKKEFDPLLARVKQASQAAGQAPKK
jgi:hypothetical protein